MNDPQPELFTPIIGLGAYREEVAAPIRSPFAVAMQISNKVAQVKWTADQQKRVDAAILTVAHRQRYFTADDIWAELGAEFPVTKGLAGRLNAAVRRKMICNTGQISHANRGGAHDHAQRLTVWSLYGV